MINKTRRSSGFTLFELIVSLTLVSVIILAVLPSLAPLARYKSKIESEVKLDALKAAVEAIYKENLFRIDSFDVDALRVAGESIPIASSPICGQALRNQPEDAFVTAPSGASCDPGVSTPYCADNPSLIALARYLPSNFQLTFKDGYGGPLCFFISKRLGSEVEGSVLFYHTIALVSTGLNGELDKGTYFDQNSGELRVDPNGDDEARIIDGFAFQLDAFKKTSERVDKIVKVLESYAKARFDQNPTRSVTTYYLSKAGEAGAGTASGIPNQIWTAATSSSKPPLNRPTAGGGAATPSGGIDLNSGWLPASIYLKDIGVNFGDGKTAYEPFNGEGDYNCNVQVRPSDDGSTESLACTDDIFYDNHAGSSIKSIYSLQGRRYTFKDSITYYTRTHVGSASGSFGSSPPYTASVVALLPGGEVIIRSAVTVY